LWSQQVRAVFQVPKGIVSAGVLFSHSLKFGWKTFSISLEQSQFKDLVELMLCFHASLKYGSDLFSGSTREKNHCIPNQLSQDDGVHLRWTEETFCIESVQDTEIP
jgi:hypothetical protein